MKVYELINTPDKWTKGALARDINDYPVYENSPDVVRWCLIGAVYKCYPPSRRRYIFKKIEAKVGMITMGHWNDTHSYEEVVKLVKKLDV